MEENIQKFQNERLDFPPDSIDKINGYMHKEMVKNAAAWFTGTFRRHSYSTNKTELPLFVTTALGVDLISYTCWSVIIYNKQMQWITRDEIVAFFNNAEWVYDNELNISCHISIWPYIHYGYVGAASAFSEEKLLSSTGIADYLKANPVNNDFWRALETNPIQAYESLDNVEEQNAVKVGFILWNEYGLNLMGNNLVSAIKRYHEFLQIKTYF